MKKYITPGYLKRQQKEFLWDLAFLTPQLIIYFTLTILPFLIAIPIVFTDQIGFIDTDIDFIGIQKF